jgi:serine/threonine-protein kinase
MAALVTAGAWLLVLAIAASRPLADLLGVPLPSADIPFGWWVLVFLAAATAFVPAYAIHRTRAPVPLARPETERMGSYHLKERLRKGGMGEVWLARHDLLARPAAIKIIRPEKIAKNQRAMETALRRFKREAVVTANLQSPHTVQLYDFGVTEDGRFYYAMELLDGVDLEKLVQEYGPLPPERVVHILQQASASLEEAHQSGLVHRDIKPGNLFVSRLALEHDFVKVIDFGLVKGQEGFAGDPFLTQPGTLSGTPAFMAPEVVRGLENADGRSDIYALGAVAYWLLTGGLVFERATPMAMIMAHLGSEPEPPSTRSEISIPPALDALVLDMLAKDPADRPQSAEEVAERLAAIELESPWTEARAARWWATHRPESTPASHARTARAA